METKICSRCKQEKPLDQFHKGKSNKDGLHYWCKECARKSAKEWYSKNKQRNFNTHKIYYEKNKTTIQEYNKKYLSEYYKENKQILCLQNKQYYDENKGDQNFKLKRKKMWREYYETNKTKVFIRINKWKKSEKGKAISIRSSHRRNSLTKNSICDLTAQDWLEIKQSQDFKCLHCGRQEPNITLERDHIIPLSKGGHLTKSNIQGLCHCCNSKKQNKIESLAFEMILRGKK